MHRLLCRHPLRTAVKIILRWIPVSWIVSSTLCRVTTNTQQFVDVKKNRCVNLRTTTLKKAQCLSEMCGHYQETVCCVTTDVNCYACDQDWLGPIITGLIFSSQWCLWVYNVSCQCCWVAASLAYHMHCDSHYNWDCVLAVDNGT